MIIDLVDKLADRIIELLTYKQQKRTELLEKYLSPIFEEFEHVHAAYLESFSRYRDQITIAQDADWIHPLQATLKKDNLFTANTRSKIRRMAQAGFYDSEGPFVHGICEYVGNIRLINPMDPNDYSQAWRNSFSEALDGIAEEDWASAMGIFSPSKEEINVLKKKVCALYPFPRKIGIKDATQRAFALYALDLIVLDMQKQYDKVCSAYAKLRKTLST